MQSRLIYILAFLLLAIVSCTNDPDNTSDVLTGRDYFPLATGQTLIYKVTEINIDKPSNVYDTTVYFLKEFIEMPFSDNEKDIAWRIERYTKPSENSSWLIKSVWSAKNTDMLAEKVEENQRIVKIRFPAKIGRTWNGNIYNDKKLQEYRISAINYDFSIGGYIFDSCLMVLHDSTSSLIHKDLAYEVYALHTGLIYKEITNINSQEVIYIIPVEERVTTGTIYKQELVGME